MKVVISGYYGFGNTGDEAILESLICGLRKRDPEIEITVLSADPVKTSKTHHVTSIKRLDLPQIIKALKRSNAFISGGGGLLQDSTGAFSVIYYLSIFLLAKLLGCKCAFLAQGFGPVKNPLNRLFSSLVLNTADIITVRDDRSLEDMIGIGVKKPPLLLAADLAFLLEGPKPATIEELLEELLKDEAIKLTGKRLLGVSVRKPVKGSEDFYKRLAALLDMAARDCEIIFIPFELPHDAEESLKVMHHMRSSCHLLSGIYSPDKLLQIISKMDYFAGMRFHSLVFAAISHVPLIGIAYDPKVSSLLNSLGSPGLEMGFIPEGSFSKLGALIGNKDSSAQSLKDKTGMFKVRAELNFSAFFEYCNPSKEISLFGIKINNLTVKSAGAMVEAFIKTGKPHFIATPNPEIIIAAQNDEALKKVINSADLCLPDGMGVLVASKLLKMPLLERVTGIDLMLEILRAAKEKGYKIFLLGSAPGVVEDAAKNLPGVNVVGTHHGYFKDVDEKEVIEKIKHSRPDVLFVGLGAPRQEYWASKHYKELGVPVTMVIGGSLDVISGKAKRAPAIVQNLGVEWLYRLAKEPKRWKRQLKLIEFMGMVIRRRMFLK